jgi:hypothetical protein
MMRLTSAARTRLWTQKLRGETNLTVRRTRHILGLYKKSER